MPNRPSPVVLRPPVEVMRPSPASEIPLQAEGAEGAEGPIWQLSLKLDGFRCTAFVLDGGRVVLQSRAGRDLAGEFPDIASAVGRLAVGTVLDGVM